MGDAIDANVAGGSGYALNATGNVNVTGQLQNTTDNNDGSDAHGISPASIDWETSGKTGYVASFTNTNSGQTGDGVLVKVYDTASETVALDVSQGSSTAAGTSLLTVRADGSIIGHDWGIDNNGDISATAGSFSSGTGNDALDVTNTGGADVAMSVTNTGTGSGLHVSSASGFDAIVATTSTGGGDDGGNALTAQGNVVIESTDATPSNLTVSGNVTVKQNLIQQSENVPVTGNMTLDGLSNIYELTSGASANISMPATTVATVVYVHNGTPHFQTINGASVGNGQTATVVYFPTSGWVVTGVF